MLNPCGKYSDDGLDNGGDAGCGHNHSNKPFNHMGYMTLVNLHDHIENMLKNIK